MKAETIRPETWDRAESRLPRWMVMIAFAGAACLLLGGRTRFAAGFLLGALLAMIGFSWLVQIVKNGLNGVEASKARSIWIKTFIRYPAALGIIYLFYRTHWLPSQAVLTGFFVPLAGALAECLVQLGEGIL